MVEPGARMSSNRAWAGRFGQATAAALDAINRSISFDLELWPEDIAGSRAHARMLARVGLLTAADATAILDGLDAVEEELRSGRFEVLPVDEDVHMAVERRLTELVGEPGRRLHTARSRNDQVATDARLWVRRSAASIRGRLARLIVTLAETAERHAADPIPAYTHLQRGMPSTLGHHLLAYAEMLSRDVERFDAAARSASVSPLGSGACAGTGLPIDREATAAELGFASISRNSLDAVSDRDFVAEFLFACTMLGLHLSRWGEEWVLWSTAEFGFVELSDAVTTGSSMMPNKKNPDGAELLRGKSGRLIGNLVTLLATLKGLPLSYNKDLQEDKEPMFDSSRTVLLGLDIALAMLGEATFRTDRMRAACSGWVNATDLCEALVRAGEPLRTAHHQTGRLVREAMALGCEIEALPLATVTGIAPRATSDMLAALRPDALVRIKDVQGGPAPDRVRAEAHRLRETWSSSAD
jgi:argininosuccinate lyase